MITIEQKEKYSKMQKKFINSAFTQAALEEDLELMQYLLTSSDLKYNADIHTGNDFAFTISCQNGNLKAVKYLLTSPELKEHADINANGNYGLIMALDNGYLILTKYLLDSPELTKHADLFANDNNAISAIIDTIDANYTDPKMKKFFSYLIKEHNIEPNKVPRINNFPDLVQAFDEITLKQSPKKSMKKKST